MRYIGNKTRLLSFLGSVLDEHDIGGGHALDAFAGTGSVARFLKQRGFRVSSCDIMTYSYVLQRAYVQSDGAAGFARLVAHLNGKGPVSTEHDRITPLHGIIEYLNEQLPDRESFVTREYSPASNGGQPVGRMYLTRRNALRVDAIRETIDEWDSASLINQDERYILLAALLEAMDAVANTTGVYAAYVKSWQPNALKRLRLTVPELVEGSADCRAHLGDVNAIAASLGPVDLLYLDPPYNTRQYSGYYHLPELVARGWRDGEPPLRGKTGLIPDSHQRSRWARRGKCIEALHELLASVDARCVLMSYNSEGIIPSDEIMSALETFAGGGTVTVHELDYARYRSDSDSAVRRYKGARVMERAFVATRNGRGVRKRR